MNHHTSAKQMVTRTDMERLAAELQKVTVYSRFVIMEAMLELPDRRRDRFRQAIETVLDIACAMNHFPPIDIAIRVREAADDKGNRIAEYTRGFSRQEGNTLRGRLIQLRNAVNDVILSFVVVYKKRPFLNSVFLLLCVVAGIIIVFV